MNILRIENCRRDGSVNCQAYNIDTGEIKDIDCELNDEQIAELFEEPKEEQKDG